MDSIAFIFPGQGSQAIGMGKKLYENSKEAAGIFDEAGDILGMDLAKLCFEGPLHDLNLTVNTQPALLTVNRAAEICLRNQGIVPKIVAGHSLGEYSALVAAEVVSFSDALRLVRKRAQFMQEAVPQGEGSMAAIVGLDAECVTAICDRVASGTAENVSPANFNCPGQIVVAGKKEYVLKTIADAKSEGAKIAKELPVSIPSHCRLMEPAALKLSEQMGNIPFSDPQIPVVANCDASIKRDGNAIREALVKQIASPVFWEKSMKVMADMGVREYIEVGTGKVLSGLLRRIDSSLSCVTAEDKIEFIDS